MTVLPVVDETYVALKMHHRHLADGMQVFPSASRMHLVYHELESIQADQLLPRMQADGLPGSTGILGQIMQDGANICAIPAEYARLSSLKTRSTIRLMTRLQYMHILPSCVESTKDQSPAVDSAAGRWLASNDVMMHEPFRSAAGTRFRFVVPST